MSPDVGGGLTVLFMPESAYGPTNQCIGLGKVLLDKGHTVVFAAEASWAGRLTPYGFVEDLVDLAAPDPDAGAEAAGQFWIDFINETAPEFAKPTIEQLATFVQPTYQALIDGARYCEPQLREIIARHRPDVIVEDNVVSFPALMTAEGAFVRIVSCNPLEIRGDDIAPVFSGYAADDRSGWADFLSEFDRTHAETWTAFDAWCRRAGRACAADAGLHAHLADREPLRLPARARLRRRPPARPDLAPDRLQRPRDRRAVRRASGLADRPADSGLVYLSLGSLGSADIALMQRLIDVLGTTRHRVIVSMGPRADELRLAENMTGAATLPQTTLMPQVDLVITHGGNNTTTEAMHFGKPMILLPLFWDQYDNAQRVHELGFGVRLATYAFADGELIGAVDRLLADTVLRERMAAIGADIRARDGLRRGAEIIERVGLEHRTPSGG